MLPNVSSDSKPHVRPSALPSYVVQRSLPLSKPVVYGNATGSYSVMSALAELLAVLVSPSATASTVSLASPLTLVSRRFLNA